MKNLSVLAAAAALAVAAPAAAATTISGKYIITIHEYCIPTMSVNSGAYSGGGNYVTGLTLGGSTVENAMVLADFNPSKQSFTVSGFTDAGNVMLMQYTGSVNGNSGSPFSESPASGKIGYANTDTTITVNGQTFNAIYGQIKKNGIAHYLAFQGVFTDQNNASCSEQGEAARQ